MVCDVPGGLSRLAAHARSGSERQGLGAVAWSHSAGREAHSATGKWRHGTCRCSRCRSAQCRFRYSTQRRGSSVAPGTGSWERGHPGERRDPGGQPPAERLGASQGSRRQERKVEKVLASWARRPARVPGPSSEHRVVARPRNPQSPARHAEAPGTV